MALDYQPLFVCTNEAPLLHMLGDRPGLKSLSEGHGIPVNAKYKNQVQKYIGLPILFTIN